MGIKTQHKHLDGNNHFDTMKWNEFELMNRGEKNEDQCDLIISVCVCTKKKDTRHNKDANYAFGITITKSVASASSGRIAAGSTIPCIINS